MARLRFRGFKTVAPLHRNGRAKAPQRKPIRAPSWRCLASPRLANNNGAIEHCRRGPVHWLAEFAFRAHPRQTSARLRVHYIV